MRVEGNKLGYEVDLVGIRLGNESNLERYGLRSMAGGQLVRSASVQGDLGRGGLDLS